MAPRKKSRTQKINSNYSFSEAYFNSVFSILIDDSEHFYGYRNLVVNYEAHETVLDYWLLDFITAGFRIP